jgi:hypothetical protein
LAVVDGFCSPEICVGKLMATGEAGCPTPLMMAASSRSYVTGISRNYAARVLPFPDRATFAFLAGFVVADTESVGAAVAELLLELSSDVARTSR